MSEANDSFWFDVMDRYKNSVIQLICVRGMYNPFRPQQPPIDKRASGTGFIVDIMNGLVLTNAHVTTNAISIAGRMTRFGERDLSLRLVSICREKDIALCQLAQEDIDRILEGKTAEDINMKFGDNLLLKETSNVVAIGYPLAQRNIKFTTGVVSGFHANSSDEDEDTSTPLTEEEGPSYIQITAPINPGNSGGPLLNRRGEVVGINAAGYMFSQNIGYAIGSRTVLGIYDALLAPVHDSSISMPHVVITPKYAFEHNKSSPALLELTCNGRDNEGIYVKRVYPNSVFDTLKEGDVITHIIYEDIYFDNPKAFDVLDRRPIQGRPVVARLDKFGDVSVDLTCDPIAAYDTNGNGNSRTPPCRKLTFKEIFDMIPIGSEISLNICRPNKDGKLCNPQDNSCGMYQIKTTFHFVPSTIRNPIYPRITPYKYVIVAGMSIGELTMNHIGLEEDLKEWAKGVKRYEPRLVVNQIFPDTTASRIRVFKEGSIIEEVNGVKVRTVDELKAVLEKSGEYITIVGRDRDKLVVKKTETKEEDTAAVKQFEIANYNSPLKV